MTRCHVTTGNGSALPLGLPPSAGRLARLVAEGRTLAEMAAACRCPRPRLTRALARAGLRPLTGTARLVARHAAAGRSRDETQDLLKCGAETIARHWPTEQKADS